MVGDVRNSEAEHDLIYEKQLDNHKAGKDDDEKLYVPDLNKFSFEIVDKTISLQLVRFKSQAGQIGHNVTYGAPPLQNFKRSCVAWVQ